MIIDLIRGPRMRAESIRAAPEPTVDGWSALRALSGSTVSETAAMKLSAVNACVNYRSDSISLMPVYAFREEDKSRPHLDVLDLLNVRPNEAMTAATMKKLVESHRLLHGNGYIWIHRDRFTGAPVEFIPLLSQYVNIKSTGGLIWYQYTDPQSGKAYRLESIDVLHYKAYTRDGVRGISVLEHAADVVRTGAAAAGYEASYYANGATVGGVLSTDTDLSPENRDVVRQEWERVHGGNANAFRVAVLDRSLKYQPIALSNRDSQFVESKEVTVRDIARFFQTPLYKLGEGKQSYNSNEQNAIEYTVGAILPTVTQLEQEDTYKILLPSQCAEGLRLRRNMDALLRGDTASRASLYKTMREIGAYSVDDILALEDKPSVPGGDIRLASLNYVPLEDFKRLSEERNGGARYGTTSP